MRKHLLTLALGAAAITATAHPIEFDRIRNWSGTGTNRAALVIQYNGNTYGTDSYVWGFRWEDGERPTGEDMMKAICAGSSRLSMLTQYTGLMGSTLNGVGYSLNQEVLKNIYFNFDKAVNFEFINFDYYEPNSFMGQNEAPGDNAPAMAQAAINAAIAGTHYIQHPFDYARYGYPAYDYDCWDLTEDFEDKVGATPYEPKWLSAWYEGYWSYWLANSPADDWMYSGTGFTGRRLTDSAVDGWSFTEFDEAMVGGMGEGIAPCEDGTIYYIPPRFTTVDFDRARCARTIGSGGSGIPMVIDFGRDAKITNVVTMLRFNTLLPDAAAVMNLLAADPAFSVEGNRLSIDADGDGVFNTSGCDSSAEGVWTLTEYEDCVVLSVAPDTALPDYLIYLPEANGHAATVLPDSMTVALRDEAIYIPMFVQREPVYNTINYTWYRRSDTLNTHSSNSSDIISSITATVADPGKLTVKGNKAGTVNIHLRARTGEGASYSYSNICRFTLAEPEIPIESIVFESDVVDAPLNSTIVNPWHIYPENATFTGLTFSSSDTKVATASATAFKTTKVAGAATITVASTWNPDVKASFEIASELRHPVTDFTLKEIEVNDDNVITLHPKQMFGAIFTTEPADADIPDMTVTFEDFGTNKDDYIFSAYRVNYWDESNTRLQFYEVSGHRAGEGKMIVKTTDGSNLEKVYTIRVEEQDRTPLENGYTEGTIMLNEEWFGHTNGGLNYITPEGEMMYQVYERENPGMSFGCTSQSAMLWADKLVAVSKQADDAGDVLRGGGRVVVADAKTLKHLGSINDLMWGDETRSSDGRAVVGATPSKIYIGSNNGIYIFDLDNYCLIGKITDFDSSGSAGADLYNGQIGDMIHAGRYVFGVKQNAGAFVIDTETDRVVKSFPELKDAQGVTQTADGNVWVADVVDGRGRFTCINPVTLEENTGLSIILPAECGYPVCGWGAWRNVAFVGSHTTNKIWFNTGGGIAGGSSTDKFFGWEVGTDPAQLKPVFDLGEAKLTGSHKNVSQKTYGTLRYDERTGLLFVMTTEDSASGHYRYNWTHFVNPETGEIVRTIELQPYYWFQCYPLFPDVHDAEIAISYIPVDINSENTQIDLSEYVKDADNIDSNIKLSIIEGSAPAEAGYLAAPAEAKAELSLNGKILTVTPLGEGRHPFTLVAESNGRTVSKALEVHISNPATAISDINSAAATIECDGSRLYINGYAGTSFRICDVSGRQMASFTADSDSYLFDFGSHRGVYIVATESGVATKVIIR